MSRFINEFERHELDQLNIQTRLNVIIKELLPIIERQDLDWEIRNVVDDDLYEEWRRVNEQR